MVFYWHGRQTVLDWFVLYSSKDRTEILEKQLQSCLSVGLVLKKAGLKDISLIKLVV